MSLFSIVLNKPLVMVFLQGLQVAVFPQFLPDLAQPAHPLDCEPSCRHQTRSLRLTRPAMSYTMPSFIRPILNRIPDHLLQRLHRSEGQLIKRGCQIHRNLHVLSSRMPPPGSAHCVTAEQRYRAVQTQSVPCV